MIFADPPYNRTEPGTLAPQSDTRRRRGRRLIASSVSRITARSRAWLSPPPLQADRFSGLSAPTANIYRVGAVLQDLGYWILNDVIWIKTNPMPNFRGIRFTNAHETLAVGGHSRQSLHLSAPAMKASERRASCTATGSCRSAAGRRGCRRTVQGAFDPKAGGASVPRGLGIDPARDIVLDPFFGTGRPAPSPQAGRRWIGIERSRYIDLPERASRRSRRLPARCSKRPTAPPAPRAIWRPSRAGLLTPGQRLYFRGRGAGRHIRADGLVRRGIAGSIHQVGSHLRQRSLQWMDPVVLRG
jgi:modification methylase